MANINIRNKVKALQGVLAAIILIASMAPCSAFADNTMPTRVWFAPRDNLARPGFYAPDFMDLFRLNAPWTQAASYVQVFKIYPQFVMSASDADLRTVIVGLQQRKIALALEFGLLTNPTLCGFQGSPEGPKVEGYCGEYIGQAAARIKALGGTLAYVAMDEPLWGGHFSTQPGALQTPIAAIAKDVANQVATIHRYFPHAQVGDIEPLLGTAAPPDYVSEVLEWINAYQRAVGIPLAFFHSDLAWQNTESQTQLRQLSAEVRSNGIKFGIIYDGDSNDTTGVAWTTDAEERFADVEKDQAMVPDDAVLQTWDAQPNHALPETQPGTMTYLVKRYAAAETILSAHQTSYGFSARITSQGLLFRGAQLFAYEVDDGTLNLTSIPSLNGVVPAGATAALAALRINTECNCDAPANILLGPAQYVDNTSNRVVTETLTPANQRIILAPGQSSLINSSTFPVTVGDAFTFSIPMQASYSSSNSGYVAIIFVNQAMKEITRMELPFQPGQQLIWAGPTNASGMVALKMPAPVPPLVKFDFNGDSTHRLSSALATTP